MAYGKHSDRCRCRSTPFIDPDEFRRFLTGKQKALHEFVEAEKNR